MAIEILQVRGFDSGNDMINPVDHKPFADGTPVISSAVAHTGTYSLTFGNGSGSYWGRWSLPTAPNDPSVSFWLYLSEGAWNNDGSYYLRFELTSGEFVDLIWNGTVHTFDAYVDSGLAASGTIVVPSHSVWFHVQFYVTIANAGHIYVKIDGHESISQADDTQPGATDTVDYFYWLYGGGAKGAAWGDDLVIGSGGYLGDLRCVDIRPNADTAQDDWTPSAGDNYSTIDETPPSDADYNETNTDAQEDELALSDYDGVTYVPHAVTMWIRARMEAATGDSIKVGMDSGGTEEATEDLLSTGYLYYFHTNDENPDGPAPWDDAAIDALLLRYESVID